MTELAVRGRLEQLMETDWKAKASILLEERLQQPGSYVSEHESKPVDFQCKNLIFRSLNYN
jgi:hypothetical protein